jgi:hypothetical protein
MSCRHGAVPCRGPSPNYGSDVDESVLFRSRDQRSRETRTVGYQRVLPTSLRGDIISSDPALDL